MLLRGSLLNIRRSVHLLVRRHQPHVFARPNVWTGENLPVGEILPRCILPPRARFIQFGV
jgi:hypothetical protein